MTSLLEIRDDFAMQYREFKGIKIMKLTTAVPVSDVTYENIRKRILDIERYKNSTLVLEEKVDPSLVGGFVIHIDDELFNACIKHDLEFIKNQFVENMYIQKIR
jgi:F-type H+-transporting ATPase subunit delta